jgi:hypothetical protein
LFELPCDLFPLVRTFSFVWAALWFVSSCEHFLFVWAAFIRVKSLMGLRLLNYIKKLRGLSPQANNTDRATAACQRS